MRDETERQFFHILLGLLVVEFLVYFGKGMLMGATFFALIFGLLLVNLTLLGRRIGFVEWFIEHFERSNIPFPGWGSACYATGVLLVTSFIENTDAVIAALLIMALGDGMSTIIGRKGKIKLPYNRKKTLEGTLAFFAVSLVGYPFVGSIIIPVAAIAAVVEGLDLPMDDNLTVPIVLTILFLVI
jgi:dolichol kinase